MTEQDLAGKRAVVTGGASGIGLACAEEFARRGAHVVIADFNAEAAQQAADALGGEAWVVDLSDTKALDNLELQADILVNNAGIQRVAPIHEYDPDTFRLIQSLMVTSPFLLIRAVLPGMYERGWGRIINISSVHGIRASAFKSAYVAAKHGILGLTKVTALENAASGITCNANCPGWVLTPLVQKQVDAKAEQLKISNEEAKKLLLGEKEPSMQFTTPEELGALAVFFCSPAGNNVRGVAWNMDGGWTAQ